MNAYTLTFAVLLMLGAALGDRLGRKRVFLVGLGIFTLGSAAAAMSPSIEWLIGARALQGVGGAIVTPLTLTILSDAVPVERRGLALGCGAVSPASESRLGRSSGARSSRDSRGSGSSG